MADRFDYRDDRGYRDRDRDERPATERVGDEVRSWFGDDEAARRRRMDEVRNDRYERDWSERAGQSTERTWDRVRQGARDWTDRDRDGRRGLAEFADNDRASYYSGYRQPQQDMWNRDRGSYSREQNVGDTSRYAPRDREYNWDPGYGYSSYRSEVTSYAGKGPRGYQRNDQRIHEDICDRLTDDPRIDASDIEVTVNGGEVTLTGSVRTREEKRFAEDLAERLSGVREVNNNLKVKPATDVIGTSRSGASVLGLNDTPPPQTRK
jgi:osmotically-inducible protein OsmY